MKILLNIIDITLYLNMYHIKVKSIVICLFLLFSIFLLYGCIEQNDNNQNWIPQFDKYYDVEVIKVIDGDTIKALMPTGNIETIRFLGIDTPELTNENNEAYEFGSIDNISCLSYYGHIASDFTKEYLKNERCSIKFDENSGFKDFFDRWLCYIYLDNDSIDFNRILLDEGLARVYVNEDFSQKDSYVIVEQNAITQKKGLWACSLN